MSFFYGLLEQTRRVFGWGETPHAVAEGEQPVHDIATAVLQRQVSEASLSSLRGSEDIIQQAETAGVESITGVAAAAGVAQTVSSPTPPPLSEDPKILQKPEGPLKTTELHQAVCMDAYLSQEKLVSNFQKIQGLVNIENVNLPDEHGNTPLHLLVSKKRRWVDGYHDAIFDALMEAGARFDLMNDKGRSVLHEITLSGNCGKGIFEKIIASGFGINTPDVDGKTPLHLLLEDEYNDFRMTLSELVDHGAETMIPDKAGNTPLHVAMISKDHLYKPKDLTYLLDHGADVNAINGEGNTPLHLLVGYNQFGIFSRKKAVELLLDRSADKNLKNKKGELPLHRAQACHRSKILDLLVPDNNAEQGADAQGRTLLHLAAGDTGISWDSRLVGCIERFKTALAVSEEPMTPDKDGKTPLHYAANIGFHEAIKALPTTAETINAVDKDGNTSIFLAVWALLSDQYNQGQGIGVTDTDLPGLKEIVRVLSTPGARFVIEDRFANLTYNRKRLAINVLLDKGANPRIANKESENAIEKVQSWLKMFGSNYRLRGTRLF